ncbi:structural maintenance of chromosomes protein 4-like isoform X3 [Xenia sp. Carnegie-2017]|uniref:structural maintenance of chromosomes protein 4-like isoform X3 n=1 Tax=Xenia sp. Carnegie-2017 TaxID=2897299 RepID=UPI001F048ED1|nr:structural maintenance of chromosomes protein 4-like isoform X3 [Xenia sp. Carnegie-2017]
MHEMIMPVEEYFGLKEILMKEDMLCVTSLIEVCKGRDTLVSRILNVFRHQEQHHNLLRRLTDKEIQNHDKVPTSTSLNLHFSTTLRATFGKKIPLVREKLHLEEIAMANIQSKQDETDADLQSTLKQLEESQRKTSVAKQMANHERMLMKKEVDSVCNLLNHVSDELAQLKMDHTSNVHIINDIKRTLKENDQQCLNLVQREERVILQEIAQQQKVKQLQEKIAEQSSEHVRLSEENHNLKKENQTMEREYHSTLTKLRTDIKQCTIQLREISRKNKTLRDDMDNVGKTMEKLKKQRNIDKKAIMRGAQEAEKVKQHVDVNQQASDAEVIVNNIREQVKELEISHGERQQATARINKTMISDVKTKLK